jgi:hypothetical protein
VSHRDAERRARAPDRPGARPRAGDRATPHASPSPGAASWRTAPPA